MAKLRVFVSSTYYDLKHIRTNLESFIEDLGYEAILSEIGNIPYHPDVPLDESCYIEAQSSDMFVLIVGGRYGSSTSTERKKEIKDFYDQYESITKKEFESAINKDIPTYILIEKSVYGEFETFKRNRDNTDVKYAHVGSVNVFLFIEQILSMQRNNPVYQFDRHTEIISWLKIQWSGLFKDLLGKRKQQKQISSIEEQVNYLEEGNKTLKTYLETIMKSVSTDKVETEKLINDEDKRLKESKLLAEFAKNHMVMAWMAAIGISLERLKEIILKASSIQEFLKDVSKEAQKAAIKSKESYQYESLLSSWKDYENGIKAINEARAIYGLSAIKYK